MARQDSTLPESSATIRAEDREEDIRGLFSIPKQHLVDRYDPDDRVRNPPIKHRVNTKSTRWHDEQRKEMYPLRNVRIRERIPSTDELLRPTESYAQASHQRYFLRQIQNCNPATPDDAREILKHKHMARGEGAHRKRTDESFLTLKEQQRFRLAPEPHYYAASDDQELRKYLVEKSSSVILVRLESELGEETWRNMYQAVLPNQASTWREFLCSPADIKRNTFFEALADPEKFVMVQDQQLQPLKLMQQIMARPPDERDKPMNSIDIQDIIPTFKGPAELRKLDILHKLQVTQEDWPDIDARLQASGNSRPKKRPKMSQKKGDSNQPGQYSNSPQTQSREERQLRVIPGAKPLDAWVLLSSAGAISRAHMDIVLGTWVYVLSGCKVWLFRDALSAQDFLWWKTKYERCFELSAQIETLENKETRTLRKAEQQQLGMLRTQYQQAEDRPDFEDTWHSVELLQGDILIMPPGVIHTVLTDDHSVVVGGHFLTINMIPRAFRVLDLLEQFPYMTNDAKPKDLLPTFYTLLTRVARKEPGFCMNNADEVDTLAMGLRQYVKREFTAAFSDSSLVEEAETMRAQRAIFVRLVKEKNLVGRLDDLVLEMRKRNSSISGGGRVTVSASV